MRRKSYADKTVVSRRRPGRQKTNFTEVPGKSPEWNASFRAHCERAQSWYYGEWSTLQKTRDLLEHTVGVSWPPDLWTMYPPSVSVGQSSEVLASTTSRGLVERPADDTFQTVVPDPIWTMDLSPDGKHLAYGQPVFNGPGKDEMVRLHLIGLDEGDEPIEFPGRPGAQIGPRFSPDNKTVAFTGWAGPLRFLDVATKKVHGLPRPFGKLSLMKPTWSAGRQIAVVETENYVNGQLRIFPSERSKTCLTFPPLFGTRAPIPFSFAPESELLLAGQDNEAGLRVLSLIDPSSQEIRLIGPQDAEVVEAVWSDQGIFLTRNLHGRVCLFHMKDVDSPATPVLPPRGCVRHLALDPSGALVYFRGASNLPYELYSYDLKTGVETPLSHFTPPDLDLEQLSPAEPFTVTSAGGVEIHGFTFAPLSDRLGYPPPGLVLPHGGPVYQSMDEFDGAVQAFCRAGFRVICPNYRGSDGEGANFSNLDLADPTRGAVLDLQAAAQLQIDLGRVDPKRVCIFGHSWGGLLSVLPPPGAPDFYAARAEVNGILDFFHQHEEGTRLREYIKMLMGAFTRKNDTVHWTASPIKYHRELARVPLLMIHGEKDKNVPPFDYELARSVRGAAIEQGLSIQIEEISVHREGHTLSALKWAKAVETAIEFFELHLAPATSSSSEGSQAA